MASALSAAKIIRAVYSERQLVELLDDFWFNHFNVFLNKGRDRYLVPSYEREVIRPHVLGKFYDLLLATAQSPAMLFYLDNWQSVGVQTLAYRQPVSGKARRGLNENYGRELLELHTLGADGGYTQKDVIEVARCFTGWTIAPPRRGGGFEYNDRVHDQGQKVVLGHVIRAGGGMSDGLEVLDILAHHPSTAHFISYKLAQRFVADDPSPALVQRMARTFLKTGGDLKSVMRTMLASRECWSEGAYHAKLKTPFELVVSALRVTNAEISSTSFLEAEMQRMGEAPLPGNRTEWIFECELRLGEFGGAVGAYELRPGACAKPYLRSDNRRQGLAERARNAGSFSQDHSATEPKRADQNCYRESGFTPGLTGEVFVERETRRRMRRASSWH